METVLDLLVYSTRNWSLSIGGLLKLNSSGICPKTHYMVLMVKSGWFVMVFFLWKPLVGLFPLWFLLFFSAGSLDLKILTVALTIEYVALDVIQ